jgi:hypothetical protein
MGEALAELAEELGRGGLSGKRLRRLLVQHARERTITRERR